MMLPNPPGNIIAMIQKSVFEFVWNKNRDMISRKIAMINIVKGGIRVQEIKNIYCCIGINVDTKI